MSRAVDVFLCALVYLTLASGIEQPVPTEDQECASGVCPTEGKKGAAMLQKRKNQAMMTTVDEESRESEAHGRSKQPFVFQSMGNNIRCHPRFRNDGWGDLGRGMTNQQCQNACAEKEECKWVTMDAQTRCTSFHTCDNTQANTGARTWEKSESVLPPTDFTYEPQPTNYRCHPSLRNNGWGDLGRSLSDQQCQDKCSAMEECKFVTNGVPQDRCTSYSSCDVTQIREGSRTWERLAGGGPAPTPAVTYTSVGANTRCHPQERNAGWGDLGTRLTAAECQNECRAAETCKFVTLEANPEGRCTSFKSCDRTQTRNGATSWEKTSGGDPCVTRCLNSRSSTVRDLRFVDSDPEEIHDDSPQLSAVEVSETSVQDPGTIFMTRERLCALRCSPTTGATRKRGLGTRAGEVRRRRYNPALRRRQNEVWQRPDGAVPQCTDPASLGLDDSWFYTWGGTDSVGGGATGRTLCARENTRVAREFVPMILNCDRALETILANIDTYKIAWEALGARFLLGYNEPDGQHQRCNASWGARQWVKVQQIANAFDPPLRLVSPSPCSGSGDSCPGGGIAFGRSPWLDAFFANCSEIPDCHPEEIEIIGMHDYEGDFDIRDDNLKVRIENAARNYAFANGMTRQVWLTEVNAACGRTSLCRHALNRERQYYRGGATDWPVNADAGISQEEHLWYQRQIIPYMENSEHVFRYTWFGSRTNASFSGYPNLLPWDDENDDTPTALGRYYMTAEGVR